MRKDIDPASYGRCEVEEIRGNQPDENDIILIAKRFMADPEPYRVITLISAEDAATFRKSVVQPAGVAPRKAISTKVKQKIHGKVQPLMSQGFLSREAAAYLTNWADQTLQLAQRPASYPCLGYRFDSSPDLRGHVVPWLPPRRERHIDLKPDDIHDPDDSGASDDLEPVFWQGESSFFSNSGFVWKIYMCFSFCVRFLVSQR